MAETNVVRTYLEITHPDQLKRVPLDRRTRFEPANDCTIPFFRFLYAEVGRRYHWRDRLSWTDEQCAARLAAPGVWIWVLQVGGTPAGYVEFERHDDGSIEIVYFGLMLEFIGRGLGKQMLSAAVERAWGMGAKRVWLHTCTLDHPAALPNYLERGFSPFKTESYKQSAAPPPAGTSPPPA
jgi:GNAT superfamily N-acetyltransferase